VVAALATEIMFLYKMVGPGVAVAIIQETYPDVDVAGMIVMIITKDTLEVVQATVTLQWAVLAHIREPILHMQVAVAVVLAAPDNLPQIPHTMVKEVEEEFLGLPVKVDIMPEVVAEEATQAKHTAVWEE